MAIVPIALSPGASGRAGIGVGGATNPNAWLTTTAPPVAPPTSNVPAGTLTGAVSGGLQSLIGSQWYQQMLANDPQLAAALAQIAAQQAAYQGQTQTAEQQLLEQYGAVPPNLGGQFQGLLTPSVLDLAAQNTQAGTSTVAQLLKAFHDQQTSSVDNLAARGLLHSGALGQHENENLQNYNVAGYNALQSLLGNLGSQQSNLLQQQGTLNQQSTEATNAAYQRILDQINAGTVSAPAVGGSAAPGYATAPAPPKPPAAASPTNPGSTSGSLVGGKATNPYNVGKLFG